jgi:hypothetical protein
MRRSYIARCERTLGDPAPCFPRLDAPVDPLSAHKSTLHERVVRQPKFRRKIDCTEKALRRKHHCTGNLGSEDTPMVGERPAR